MFPLALTLYSVYSCLLNIERVIFLSPCPFVKQMASRINRTTLSALFVSFKTPTHYTRYTTFVPEMGVGVLWHLFWKTPILWHCYRCLGLTPHTSTNLVQSLNSIIDWSCIRRMAFHLEGSGLRWCHVSLLLACVQYLAISIVYMWFKCRTFPSPRHGRWGSGRRCPWEGCDQEGYCCCPATQARRKEKNYQFYTTLKIYNKKDAEHRLKGKKGDTVLNHCPPNYMVSF